MVMSGPVRFCPVCRQSGQNSNFGVTSELPVIRPEFPNMQEVVTPMANETRFGVFDLCPLSRVHPLDFLTDDSFAGRVPLFWCPMNLRGAMSFEKGRDSDVLVSDRGLQR